MMKEETWYKISDKILDVGCICLGLFLFLISITILFMFFQSISFIERIYDVWFFKIDSLILYVGVILSILLIYLSEKIFNLSLKME